MLSGISILGLEDRDRWEAEHRDGGLPSQSWRYAWGLSASGVNPRLAVIHCEGARMLLPFVERDWGDSIDIATLLGPSGASLAPISSAPLALWREFAEQQRWVAGYIKLAVTCDIGPPSMADLVKANAGERLAMVGTATILDLRGLDLLVSAARSIKKKIRVAIERRYTVVEQPDRLAEALKRLYPESMDRLAASAAYRFSPVTLDRWMDDPASVILGASLDGIIEAVYVFRAIGSHAEAHITGSSERGRDLIPWLIWHGIERLRSRGVTTLNLGGGLRPGDGLSEFKQRFGPSTQHTYALCQIYDKDKYSKLRREAGVRSDALWFPAYREAEAGARAKPD